MIFTLKILQEFQNYCHQSYSELTPLQQSDCDSNWNVQVCLSIVYKSTLHKNLRKTVIE